MLHHNIDMIDMVVGFSGLALVFNEFDVILKAVTAAVVLIYYTIRTIRLYKEKK